MAAATQQEQRKEPSAPLLQAHAREQHTQKGLNRVVKYKIQPHEVLARHRSTRPCCGSRPFLHASHWNITSHVTRHTSHVTRHTSHVTRHTSHVTRHTSHVTRHTSHAVLHHNSPIGLFLSSNFPLSFFNLQNLNRLYHSPCHMNEVS
jgi:hypothetical protein